MQLIVASYTVNYICSLVSNTILYTVTLKVSRSTCEHVSTGSLHHPARCSAGQSVEGACPGTSSSGSGPNCHHPPQNHHQLQHAPVGCELSRGRMAVIMTATELHYCANKCTYLLYTYIPQRNLCCHLVFAISQTKPLLPPFRHSHTCTNLV